MQLDIGFGDIIVPKPNHLEFPTLLEMNVPKLNSYSLESVIAEKFEAMLTLSVTNSRLKDFYDIYMLLQSIEFDGRVLQEAIFETFQRRKTILERKNVIFTDEFVVNDERNNQWMVFHRKIGASESPSFRIVMQCIIKFLKPIYESILNEEEFQLKWNRDVIGWEKYKNNDKCV